MSLPDAADPDSATEMRMRPDLRITERIPTSPDRPTPRTREDRLYDLLEAGQDRIVASIDRQTVVLGKVVVGLAEVKAATESLKVTKTLVQAGIGALVVLAALTVFGLALALNRPATFDGVGVKFTTSETHTVTPVSP